MCCHMDESAILLRQMKNNKRFVYLATSLTHLPEQERSDLIKLVQRLKAETRFLEWAFDVTKWCPQSVGNICSFDLSLVGLADFVAGVFFSSAGSDGRGVEIYDRAKEVGRKGLQIYVREGVKVSPFILDMVGRFNLQPVKLFKDISRLGDMILSDSRRNVPPKRWRDERTFNVKVGRVVYLENDVIDPQAAERFLALKE